MKITEAIKQLQEILNEHGDLEVMSHSGETPVYNPELVWGIDYRKEHEFEGWPEHVQIINGDD